VHDREVEIMAAAITDQLNFLTDIYQEKYSRTAHDQTLDEQSIMYKPLNEL
jgi:hypothetical protein